MTDWATPPSFETFLNVMSQKGMIEFPFLNEDIRPSMLALTDFMVVNPWYWPFTSAGAAPVGRPRLVSGPHCSGLIAIPRAMRKTKSYTLRAMCVPGPLVKLYCGDKNGARWRFRAIHRNLYKNSPYIYYSELHHDGEFKDSWRKSDNFEDQMRRQYDCMIGLMKAGELDFDD